MAGDWIKMRSNLFTHPKVVRIASALKADTLRTVGGLMSVWCLFDAHSIDGRLAGYTPEVIDDLLRWDGFAQAMISVGWLELESIDGAESLCLPEFDTHNGQSAKRRAQDADRKRIVRNVSACEADKKRTREEKRREDISTPPKSPKGDRECTLSQWLEEIKISNEKPVSDYATIWKYAEEVGLTHDHIELAWIAFRRYWAEGAGAKKRKKDWRLTFLNAVKENRGRIWWRDEANQCWGLTTVGKQLDIETREAA